MLQISKHMHCEKVTLIQTTYEGGFAILGGQNLKHVHHLSAEVALVPIGPMSFRQSLIIQLTWTKLSRETAEGHFL